MVFVSRAFLLAIGSSLTAPLAALESTGAKTTLAPPGDAALLGASPASLSATLGTTTALPAVNGPSAAFPAVNGPTKLIEVDDVEGRLELSDDARAVFQQLVGPVYVVVLHGDNSMAGKSTLLSLFVREW